MKENKAFTIPFITKNNKKADQLCIEYSSNLDTNHGDVPQSSILMHPFLMFHLFQKCLNTQVRTNKWY